MIALGEVILPAGKAGTERSNGTVRYGTGPDKGMASAHPAAPLSGLFTGGSGRRIGGV
jgi:hypothetical protein